MNETLRLLHERLLRDDPNYREEWEQVNALFRTLLADAELPDEPEEAA